MRDVWLSGLEWFSYYTHRQRKPRFTAIIMDMKAALAGITSVDELAQHYVSGHTLCHASVARLFPNDWWLETQQAEDTAYGLRCIELTTGKSVDLGQGLPSRWLLATVV